MNHRLITTEVKYLFIDGGYLRKVLESISQEYFNQSELPVDYVELSRGFTKTFYYDCLAPRRANEQDKEYEKRMEPQRAFFRRLRSLSGWHVVEGVVSGVGDRARQKEVDIKICVDMLTHSHLRNMHRIAFIAGDRDFKPLVDAVVREGMFIEIWYHSQSANDDLVLSADSRRLLDVYTIHHSLERNFQQSHQLPERFSKQGKDIANSTLLEVGVTDEGENIELYQDKGKTPFTIVEKDKSNEGYFMHMRYDNIEYLKKVFLSTEGHVTWSSAK